MLVMIVDRVDAVEVEKLDDELIADEEANEELPELLDEAELDTTADEELKAPDTDDTVGKTVEELLAPDAAMSSAPRIPLFVIDDPTDFFI